MHPFITTKIPWVALVLCLAGNTGLAQSYNDYLGAGHDQGITITGSGSEVGFAPGATVDGAGIDSAYMRLQASRFLAQATLGANRQTIEAVAEMGFERWIDEQLEIPPTYLQPLMEESLAFGYQLCENSDLPFEECEFLGDGYTFQFNQSWWQAVMTGEDLLRQRVALALSEILVTSGIALLEEPFAEVVANYYDLLLEHAFGSYEELLYEVTLHPFMGMYLSHFNNPKTDTVANIRPDENYAREVMQLFSIGLFELNLDGSLKLDANGQPIPTYDNDDIKEFAKVFTGLSDGGEEGYFGIPPDIFEVNFFLPMRMYEEWHEPGPKYLLNNFVVPAGQSGLEDIQMAIHHLATHPNTAPFISYRLIQRLVKSNPSPAYIERVASVFEDNGAGERGDLGAVVKAILLDPEARDCNWLDEPENGKLREPIVRYTHVLKALEAANESMQYWNTPYWFWQEMRQLPMFAPSVFNFFLPDYQPNGPVAEAGLAAPEFQLHNTATAIAYFNMSNAWAVHDYLMENEIGYEVIGQEFPEEDYVEIDYENWESLDNPAVMLDELALLLAHDQLSPATRQTILNALQQLEGEFGDQIRMAIYLILISPDYNVIR